MRAGGRRVKFLYTIPNFHNPAGVTLAVQRRAEILEICAAHGVLVVEDNPYGLLGFDGQTYPALRSADPNNVVYLGSFSKTFAPGLRVGWVLAPHAVREKLVLAAESATLCPPAFNQAVVSRYLSQHDWKGQIKTYRETYRERRDAMLAAMEQHLPAGLHVDQARRRLLLLADRAGGRGHQGDAAPGRHRAGGLRARHRVLRRQLRQPAAAAVVLLPDARADPRGRSPAGRRAGRRAGAAAARSAP